MQDEGDQQTPSIRTAGPATHYGWGDGCDGWRLLETPGLRVREESIPPGRAERPHLHRLGQQAFYVLSGVLTIRLPGETRQLRQGDLMEIPAGLAHEVRNDTNAPVRFLAITAPAVDGDREESAVIVDEPAP